MELVLPPAAAVLCVSLEDDAAAAVDFAAVAAAAVVVITAVVAEAVASVAVATVAVGAVAMLPFVAAQLALVH